MTTLKDRPEIHDVAGKVGPYASKTTYGLVCTLNKSDFDYVAAADLARALNILDVPFIAGGSDSTTLPMPQPAVLMASLAASDEARLRLALIPLLWCQMSGASVPPLTGQTGSPSLLMKGGFVRTRR